MDIVVADIGGTNARFALVDAETRELRWSATLSVPDFRGIEQTWAVVSKKLGHRLPGKAALALAAPMRGNRITFPNSGWSFERDRLAERLNLETLLLLNDFEAVAHAVESAASDDFEHLAGPEAPLPERGAIAIIGPGTGLGVAMLLRREGGYQVIGTEAAHIPFTPLNPLEDSVRRRLEQKLGRVSVERVISGPGLRSIWQAISESRNEDMPEYTDADLWRAAPGDPVGQAALDIFADCLAAFAGDVALAQGSHGIVLSGSIVRRLGKRLQRPAWHARFADKGRYRGMMETIPVKRLTIAEPGLAGALHAFRQKYGCVEGR